MAREKAKLLDTENFAQIGAGEPDRLRGQGKPAHMPAAPERPFDPEDFVRRVLHYMWNWRLIGSSREFVAQNVKSFGPAGRQSYGIGDYMQNIVARLAMFPDLVHSVHDVYWMGNDAEGYQVAVRWSLIGIHTGYGIYGKHTGRRVRMWGISHFAIEGGKIVEDWTMFNEYFVLQQILRDEAFS